MTARLIKKKKLDLEILCKLYISAPTWTRDVILILQLFLYSDQDTKKVSYRCYYVQVAAMLACCSLKRVITS